VGNLGMVQKGLFLGGTPLSTRGRVFRRPTPFEYSDGDESSLLRLVTYQQVFHKLWSNEPCVLYL
jgi:hypothetical protein